MLTITKRRGLGFVSWGETADQYRARATLELDHLQHVPAPVMTAYSGLGRTPGQDTGPLFTAIPPQVQYAPPRAGGAYIPSPVEEWTPGAGLDPSTGLPVMAPELSLSPTDLPGTVEEIMDAATVLVPELVYDESGIEIPVGSEGSVTVSEPAVLDAGNGLTEEGDQTAITDQEMGGTAEEKKTSWWPWVVGGVVVAGLAGMGIWAVAKKRDQENE